MMKTVAKRTVKRTQKSTENCILQHIVHRVPVCIHQPNIKLIFS